jgi:hypothetical protein
MIGKCACGWSGIPHNERETKDAHPGPPSCPRCRRKNIATMTAWERRQIDAMDNYARKRSA